MKLRNILGLVFSGALLGISLLLFFNRQDVIDWWRLRDYTPPVAIAKLSKDSSFSPRGQHLFYVYYPELLDKANFQGKCNADEATIVLGCYISGDRIYILNVNNKQLDGVEEVTAAHEMLHAVYDRMSKKEKDSIDKLLLSTYKGIKNPRIRKTIASYKARDPSIVPNELHSILGTEVEKLPKKLEEHYDEFFKDRQLVVAQSKAYANAFTQREDKIKAYDSSLAVLSTQIKQLKTDLGLLNSSLGVERTYLDSLKSDPSAYNTAIPGFNRKVSS